MSRGPFQAEVRRELRDRRAGILVLAASVAAMIGLAWLITGGFPTQDLRDAMPGAAVFLAFVVVGLDLFSRGVRGGPWALVLRTPGAFRTAFAARLLVLLVAALVALAVEEGARHSLQKLTHVGWGTHYGGGPLDTPRHGLWLALALSSGMWIVVGSVWSAAGGAASLIGLLGFFLAVAPFAILHTAYPYAFFTYRSDVWTGGLAFAALGLAVLAIGYAWGRRRLTGGGRATYAGIGLAALLSCSGAAVALGGVTRWLALDLAQPEARLAPSPFALLGEGERYLYVTAFRNRQYDMQAGRWAEWYRDRSVGGGEAPDGPGTPPRPYVIDLVDGSSRPIGEYGEFVWLAQGVGSIRAAVPVPWVTVTNAWPNSARTRWIDARTGTRRLVVEGHRQPPETTPWAREVARALSPHRDSKGRRVWTLDGRLDREGEPEFTGPRPYDVPWVQHIPGGWRIYSDGRWRFLDLETGMATSVLDARPDGRGPGATIPLGASRFLARGNDSIDEYRPGDDRWTLVDRDSMTETPTGLVERDEVVAALPDGRAAILGGDPLRLFLWEPTTGARTEVRSDRADPLPAPQPMDSGIRMRLTASGTWLPDGRVLLAWSERVDMTPIINRGSPYSWSVLDPASATERVIGSTFAMRAEPVACLSNGAVIVIEDERRVVRLGPAAGERVVLWPREGARRP